MDIVDYIPFGRENAVTRTQLRIMTGLNDRQIREQISQARRDTVILNMQDGKGYFSLFRRKKKTCRSICKAGNSKTKEYRLELKGCKKNA